ncbi:synaptonemal complex protein 3-like [Synchiropus splendidus]|uniref:synaptonemal complex protein 3-like n=1 Tax=Synchiropus splendidus TaxID=270530 RepID=UPI00237E9840|nr:synaptonemal complex protein 3-like [Synchiropus splendidus]
MSVRRHKKKKVEDNSHGEKSELRRIQEQKRGYTSAQVGRIVEDHADLPYKKRRTNFQGEGSTNVEVGVHSMLERFGADIRMVMRTKRRHLEGRTKTYIKGSQQNLEQLWNRYHGQRKRMTRKYSEQVSSALQQWETGAQRAVEQADTMNDLLKQQQTILHQARLHQNQKLDAVRELFEQFVKNMEDLETSHERFLQNANQELRKEMGTLQKKILMDTQRRDLATVRMSLRAMLL